MAEKKKKQKKTDLSERIKELENQLEIEKERKLEVLADFENYKKRMQKEKENLNLVANATVLNMLLEVMDDLRRAVSDMKETPAGLKMIQDKIDTMLNDFGIEKIEVTEGDEFDASRMEAIGTVAVKEEKKVNKVVHVERTGYKIKDKDFVVRGVRVIVGKEDK